MKYSKEFRVEDCPEDFAVHTWMFDSLLGVDGLDPEKNRPHFVPQPGRLQLSPALLKNAVAQIGPLFDRLGWFGFADIYSIENSTCRRSNSYGGLGLTYNPNFIGPTPPLAQVLGATSNKMPMSALSTDFGKEFYRQLLDRRLDKFFFNEVVFLPTDQICEWIKNLNLPSGSSEFVALFTDHAKGKIPSVIKNTYSDSYTLVERTEAGRWKGISELLDAFPMQLVRSRIVEMKSHEVNSQDLDYFWHRDDHPIKELRVLICLKATHSEFGIEFADHSRYYLREGDVLSWDTSLPHRAFCSSFQTGSRVCLVLGFAPWFDFNKSRNVWTVNERFDREHPFDTLSKMVDSKVLIETNETMFPAPDHLQA